MVNMCQVQAVWSGFLGGPGTNTFYTVGGDVDPGDFQGFFEGIEGYMPDNVTVLVENGGPVLQESNGELVGGWSHSAQTPTTGTWAGVFTAGQGAVLRLDTGVFRRGRRVLGRAFLVPLSAEAFDSTGLVSTAVAAGIVAAGNDLVAAYSGALGVWHRPHGDDPGEILPVANVAVPLRPASLRSRKD